MSTQTNYIKTLNISGLWNRLDVTWELEPEVNILAGINGVGKSSILNCLIAALRSYKQPQKNGELPAGAQEVSITLASPQAEVPDFDVVRSYDNPLYTELPSQVGDVVIHTETDWQLYLLQRRFLDYQVRVANSMLQLLSSGEKEQAEEAVKRSKVKALFQDLLDEMFEETGKKIDRTQNEVAFIQNGEPLPLHKLSSGEKQLLIIMITALVRSDKPAVLIMDEPEASLHIEWQQKLISTIRRINPHIQIVLSTHSPALIMNGWMDAVTEVQEIVHPHNNTTQTKL